MEIVRLPIENHRDSTGLLSATNLSIPGFLTKRIYLVSDAPVNVSRGFHAHRNLEQIFWAINGDVELFLHDGKVSERVVLVPNAEALFLPAGIWREFKMLSTGASLLVAANQEYDECDYIRDFEKFLEWKKNGK